MSLIISCALNCLFFMEKPYKCIWKLYLINEHVFLNTLVFRKRKRNVTRICSTCEVKLSFLRKGINMFKKFIVKSILWFCHFNLTWCSHHASLLLVRVARVQKSSTGVFDKMETVPRVYTGVCILTGRNAPIYWLLPKNLLN